MADRRSSVRVGSDKYDERVVEEVAGAKIEESPTVSRDHRLAREMALGTHRFAAGRIEVGWIADRGVADPVVRPGLTHAGDVPSTRAVAALTSDRLFREDLP